MVKSRKKWKGIWKYMEILELKKLKEEKQITNEKLSELSGVSYSTITKIFSGATKRPRADKLLAIENAIRGFINDESGALDLSVFAKKKYNTVEDWLNLPDDRRAELIDGVFYDMAEPTIWHQRVAGLVYFEAIKYVREKGGNCLPLISPVGVQLDKDDKTVVEPDVVIVCDPDKVKDRVIYGAPDWVLEVVSPSSKTKDYIVKLGKYQNAGVREYWIIDRKQERVTVYSHLDDSENMEVKIYGFSEPVPVGIYDDLILDLSEIQRY